MTMSHSQQEALMSQGIKAVSLIDVLNSMGITDGCLIDDVAKTKMAGLMYSMLIDAYYLATELSDDPKVFVVSALCALIRDAEDTSQTQTMGGVAS